MIGASNTPTFGYFNPSAAGADPSFFGNAQAAMAGIGQGISAVGAGFQAAGQFAVGAYNQLGMIGEQIRPFFKAMPAEMVTGHGGLYMQPTGFFQGLSYGMGFGHAPRHATPMEYGYAIASDFGERVGGGAAAAGLMAAPIAGALALGMVPGGRYVTGAPTKVTMAAGRALGGMVGSPFGAAGLKWGAKVGAGVGWLAAPMALYSVIDSVQESIQDRLVNQGILEAGSFRFVGAGSEMAGRLASGMGRRARRRVAEMIRTTDIEDPFLGDDDLRQILQESTRLGLFVSSGGNMDNFKKRFKEIKEGVKDLMKTLNVTLEEGLNTMRDLSTVGVGVAQAPMMAKLADALGRASGRTGQEMLTLGLQGAELYRGTGISMDIGLQANMMNVAAIRAARDAGWISKQMIAQMGGEESAAQAMTMQGMAYAQSPLGRGFMASFYDPKTGGMDVAQFRRNIMAGGEDINTQVTRAAAAMASPADIIRYTARQEEFLTEVGGEFGGRGLQLAQYSTAMGLAGFYSRNTGANMEDSFIYALRNMGMSADQAKSALGMIRGREDIFKSAQAGAVATASRLQAEAAARRSFTYQMGERMRDYWARYVTDPIGRPIVANINDLQDWWVDFTERNRGLVTVDTAAGDIDIIGRNLTTDQLQEAATAFEDELDVVDLTDFGTSFIGLRSVGGDIQAAMERGTFGRRYTGALSAYSMKRGVDRRDVMYLTEPKAGMAMGVRTQDWRDIQKISDTLSLTLPEAEALQKRGDLDRVFGDMTLEQVRSNIREAIDTAKITGEETVSEVANIAVGRHVERLVERATMPKPLRDEVGRLEREMEKAIAEGRPTDIPALQKRVREVWETREADLNLTPEQYLEKMRTDPTLVHIFGQEELERGLRDVRPGRTIQETRDRIMKNLEVDTSILSRRNYAAVLLGLKEEGMEDMLKQTITDASLVVSTSDVVSSMTTKEAMGKIEGFREELSKELGFELAPGVVEALSARKTKQDQIDKIDMNIEKMRTRVEDKTTSPDERNKLKRDIEIQTKRRNKLAEDEKGLTEKVTSMQQEYDRDEGLDASQRMEHRRSLLGYANLLTRGGTDQLRKRYETLVQKQETDTGLTDLEQEELGKLTEWVGPKDKRSEFGSWWASFAPEALTPKLQQEKVGQLQKGFETVQSAAAFAWSMRTRASATLMGDALAHQLLMSDEKDLSEQRRQEVVSSVSQAVDVRGLMAIPQDVLKDVRGTSIGDFIRSEREFIKRLKDPKTFDINKVEERLASKIEDDDTRKRIAKVFKDEGVDKGIEAYYNQTLVQLKGQRWTSGAGLTGDVEQQTALKNLEIQTNLNLGFLMALSGLAAKLGVTLPTK